jgi:hypothetical protein
MPPRKVTFDTVRKIGLAMPEVEESTAYGSPALKVKGRTFACIATNKAADPDTLVVRVPFPQRDEIAAEPGVYYLEDHYEPYPAVLVRLSRIHPDALKDLLHTSARFVAGGEKRKRDSR